MAYRVEESGQKWWCWPEMVAQLDNESMAYVVYGPNGGGGGLTECWIAHDHKRHHELKEERKPLQIVQLRVRDFLINRRDGTPVRLRPQCITTNVDTFVGEGHEAEVETPAHGPGESDGMGHLQALRSYGQPEDSEV